MPKREEVEQSELDFLPDHEENVPPQYDVRGRTLTIAGIVKEERDATDGADLANTDANRLVDTVRKTRADKETTRHRADAVDAGEMDDARSGGYQPSDAHRRFTNEQYAVTKAETEARINHTTRTAMVGRRPSHVGYQNGFAAIVADKARLARCGLKKADMVRAVQEPKERMVELKLEWHKQWGATTKDAVLHKYRTDEDTERTLAQKHNLRVVSKPRDDPQSKFTKQPAIVDKANRTAIVAETTRTPSKFVDGALQKNAEVRGVAERVSDLKKNPVKRLETHAVNKATGLQKPVRLCPAESDHREPYQG